jgi:hypothetical protein
MGRQGFVKFNDLIISLSDSMTTSRSNKLSEIGRAGHLSTTCESAVRPTLKKAP